MDFLRNSKNDSFSIHPCLLFQKIHKYILLVIDIIIYNCWKVIQQ